MRIALGGRMNISKEQQKENEAFLEATKEMQYDECGHPYLDEGNLAYIFGKGVEFGMRRKKK